MRPYRVLGRIGEVATRAVVQASGQGYAIEVNADAMPAAERDRAESALRRKV